MCILVSELGCGPLNNSIKYLNPHKLNLFTTVHFDWNPFLDLLSDFCELYLPKINYGLLILQNFLEI